MRILNTAESGDSKNLVYLPHKLAVLLKPHQLEGLRFAWNHVIVPPKASLKGCILAHCTNLFCKILTNITAMGLGKTLQMVAFCYMFIHEKKGRSILIACPKIVIRNWKNEFEKWLRLCELEMIQCFCMDESTKRNVSDFAVTLYELCYKDRESVVKEWKESGGVLIISYEMYSILVDESRTKEEYDSDQMVMPIDQSYTPIQLVNKKRPLVILIKTIFLTNRNRKERGGMYNILIE